ncbi:hypothetical protein [Rhodobacter lacus]|uniref:Uncharacterized protein n=1 Tax=Rhodobacter lacus TaxID=1641972 RepID=A0ABW5ABB4_9RHOB
MAADDDTDEELEMLLDLLGAAAIVIAIIACSFLAAGLTGNDTFEIIADPAFDGTVDDLVAYLETTACLAQGTHYVWIEPQNADGAAGPLSGPYIVEMI